MSSDTGYDQLLEAAVQHLEGLKAEGVRFVELHEPGLLGELMAGPGAAGRISPPGAPVSTATAPPPGSRLTQETSTRLATVSAPPVPSVGSTPPASAPPSAPKPVQVQAPVAAEEEISFDAAEPAEPRASSALQELETIDFETLRSQVLACAQCAHLARSRKKVVFGVGDPQAALMFVGEAPGADEDAQGEPFVGPAGQLLDKIIQTMGLSRDRVYIANVLKCRPDTPGQSYGNRKPTGEEMQTCLPYLRAQIRLIQPKVMVALGATAMEGLFGKTVGITKVRGHWQNYEGIPLMPTYHPSYLLRTQDNLATRRQTWEDMLQVMEKLGLPVTEKMRGYFLAPR